MTGDDKLFLKKLLPAAKYPICNAFAGSGPKESARTFALQTYTFLFSAPLRLCVKP